MNWVKQNWIKVGVGILILISLFLIKEWKGNSSNSALINDAVKLTTPSPTTISEKDPKMLALEQSLPHFEDYPVKVYPIPPKPLLVHESNPYGMRYWTLTENWINEATAYNMAGHYLMDRYATGNPDVLIIDGLTGKVFNEYGSLYPVSVANSSLVIFDPIKTDCFSPDGDCKSCYAGEENPRYAVWDGKQFTTICEPIIKKKWELISCGEVAR